MGMSNYFTITAQDVHLLPELMLRIEKAGTGTGDIVEKCLAYGLAKPEYQQDEDFRVVIYRPGIAADDQSEGLSQGPQSGPQSGTQSRAPVGTVDSDLGFLPGNRGGSVRSVKKLGYSDRTKFRNRYLKPLLTANLLEITIPDKPTSSQQKYRTTAKGLELLAGNSRKEN